MSNSNTGWLSSQLPSELHWGDPALKLTIKGAPTSVKSFMATLKQVYTENPDKAMKAVAADGTHGDKTQAVIPQIPDKPNKHWPAGTYKLDYIIKNKDGSLTSGRKIYHGLELAQVNVRPGETKTAKIDEARSGDGNTTTSKVDPVHEKEKDTKGGKDDKGAKGRGGR